MNKSNQLSLELNKIKGNSLELFFSLPPVDFVNELKTKGENRDDTINRLKEDNDLAYLPIIEFRSSNNAIPLNVYILEVTKESIIGIDATDETNSEKDYYFSNISDIDDELILINEMEMISPKK